MENQPPAQGVSLPTAVLPKVQSRRHFDGSLYAALRCSFPGGHWSLVSKHSADSTGLMYVALLGQTGCAYSHTSNRSPSLGSQASKVGLTDLFQISRRPLVQRFAKTSLVTFS